MSCLVALKLIRHVANDSKNDSPFLRFPDFLLSPSPNGWHCKLALSSNQIPNLEITYGFCYK